jgi:hypothetical protein
MHLVSAWVAENRVGLGAVTVDQKSNDRSAILVCAGFGVR